MKLRATITCKECVRMDERICSKPSGKCSVERNRLRKNSYTPSRRLSDYGIQLREKQKARIMYGLRERQFRNYVKKASKMEGIAGENLLSILESRLDNTVFRLGFGRSRAHSRQLVSHGHFLVNGRIVDIPSYLLRNVPEWLKSDRKNGSGDVISRPETDDMEIGIQTRLIIEYYSRR